MSLNVCTESREKQYLLCLTTVLRSSKVWSKKICQLHHKRTSKLRWCDFISQRKKKVKTPKMGIAFGIQKDHSKSYTINIKVPNAVVTFSNFPSDETFARDLQKDVQYIMQSTWPELPSDYRIILQKLFAFLDSSQSIVKTQILKYSTVADSKDIINQFSLLESHTTTLKTIFEMSLSSGMSEENRDRGTYACQQILRYFSDESGILFKNFLLTTPCLVTFVGIYRNFVQFWGHQNQDDQEMALLDVTVKNYEQKCIQERLDNIKMLRTQSESL